MNSKFSLLFVMSIGLLSSHVSGMDSDDTSQTCLGPLERSSLHDAAFAGDEKTLLHLLNRYGVDADDSACIVNAPDLQGRTPLHYAVKSGSAECVAILLKSGANPNVSDRAQVSDRSRVGVTDRSECNSPLDFAVKQGRVKIVEQLLNAPSMSTKTVHSALAKGLIARDRTVRSNKDKKSKGAYVNNDLTCNDLYNGIDDCCYALLQYSKFAQKYPELRQQYQAVYTGDLILLEGAADELEYPLHVAVRDGDLNRFKQSLLTCQIDEIDDTGKSPLCYAVQSFNAELTKLVFSAGAQPSQEEKDELLHFVTHYIPAKTMYSQRIKQFSESRKNIAELLIAQGADVDRVIDPSTGRTLLHEAVIHNDSVGVQFLLMHKANMHFKDDCGVTPIDLAYLLQHRDVMEIFDTHSGSVSQALTANTAIINLVPPRDRRVSAGEKIECYDQPEKTKRRRSSN